MKEIFGCDKETGILNIPEEQDINYSSIVQRLTHRAFIIQAVLSGLL